MRRTRIKICCIGSLDEARLAMAEGADALGLVGAMPSGPGPIDDLAIAEIAAAVPPPVATFLLTSETEAEAIIDHARRCRTNTLQLVDRLSHAVYARLRTALPAVKLVQVIHVTGPEALDETRAVAPEVAAILLDSGRPHAPVKELGGTGRVHDWRISQQIVDAVPRPVFLAGGLRADNVGAAIAEVRPYGVDLCTGVRTDGRLDPAKLGAFVAAVARADAAGSSSAAVPAPAASGPRTRKESSYLAKERRYGVTVGARRRVLGLQTVCQLGARPLCIQAEQSNGLQARIRGWP